MTCNYIDISIMNFLISTLIYVIFTKRMKLTRLQTIQSFISVNFTPNVKNFKTYFSSKESDVDAD
jgi:hypothetical protein